VTLALSNVHIVEHALVAAKMSRLRDKTTPAHEFRRALVLDQWPFPRGKAKSA
jgi:hypothetical protein